MKTKFLFLFALALSCGFVSAMAATQAIPTGKMVTITCTHDKPAANPPDTKYSYQWVKDGRGISGATSAVLTIPNFTSADAGTYVCKVYTRHGTSEAPIVQSDQVVFAVELVSATNVRLDVSVTSPATQ